MPAALGLDSDGKFIGLPPHEPEILIQNIGGKGRCSWHSEPISLDVVKALRTSLRAALDRLDAQIAEAERD